MSASLSPRELTPEGLRRLARMRLAAELAPGAPGVPASAARPAAVLAPIVARPEGMSVLLTVRAANLRDHSGQIAFPGGVTDPGETPGQTALREAEEEIGLGARFIEPLGWLDPFLTGTGYWVAPLVALIDPGFTLSLSAEEVAEAFETPFAFLMDAANHRREERVLHGKMRKFYAMPHGERYIWGITAGILRNLYEKLFT